MTPHVPVSVLLPTVRRTDAIDQVAAQLVEDDELLVICDADDDPIAAAAEAGELPDPARLVVAGEPETCSGKANAIAAGMDAARHERLVWTDDDFDHPPDWLGALLTDYERHGPVTELPFFRGRDPLAVLVEPLYALTGTLGVSAGEKVWGGAVCFERDDLTVPADLPQDKFEHETDDQAAFIAALRRTVSDDGLLSEFLNVTSIRRTRTVDVGGSIRETLERHVRFSKLVRQHAPVATRIVGIASLLVVVACLLFPLPTLAAATLLVGGVYARLGIRRWTFLLAYPAAIATVPLGLYATGRRTFVWGGRRYRWRSKFDVEVVEE